MPRTPPDSDGTARHLGQVGAVHTVPIEAPQGLAPDLSSPGSKHGNGTRRLKYGIETTKVGGAGELRRVWFLWLPEGASLTLLTG